MGSARLCRTQASNQVNPAAVCVGLHAARARPQVLLHACSPLQPTLLQPTTPNASTPTAHPQFYPAGEADEVDGIEEGLDKWLQGLWPALKAAVAPEGAAADKAADTAAAPAAEPELAGVPPLPRCRVRLVWQERGAAAAAEGSAAAAAAAAAASVHPQLEFRTPTAAELAYRDPEGHYSAEQPFWAPVTKARWLTTDQSDADRQASRVVWDVKWLLPGWQASALQRGPSQAVLG